MNQAKIFQNKVAEAAEAVEYWDGELEIAYMTMQRIATEMGGSSYGGYYYDDYVWENGEFVFPDGSQAVQSGSWVQVVKEISKREQAAQEIQQMVVNDRRFNGPVITNVEKKTSKRGKSYYGFTGMVAGSTDFTVEVYSEKWIQVTWQTQVRALPYQERRGRIFGNAEDVKKFLTFAFVAGQPEKALQVPTK